MSENLLEKFFDELNEQHFDGLLDRPLLRWNSRLRSSAGRFISGTREGGLAHRLSPRPPVIEIAAYLLKVERSEHHIRDTMGHEMIHYWLWVRRRPFGHTQEFWARMKQMGVSRYNSAPQRRSYRHWYECVACGQRYPTRKRLGRLACAACCRKHARGYFDARFLLAYGGPIQADDNFAELMKKREPAENPS